MFKLILLLTLSSFSLYAQNSTVTIFKQWHLLPNSKTLNIKGSMLYPQFQSQVDIYLESLKLIKENKTQLIIAEGCEGEIGKKFKKAHYGWSFKKLEEELPSPEYKNIMALIPLKIKVKLKDKIRVICGDSEELMEKHQLAFSDLRAYIGYAYRLKDIKDKSSPKYIRFSKSLLDGVKTDLTPLKYAKKKAIESLNLMKKITEQRNDIFIKVIKKHSKLNPLVIIGGLHVEGLVQKLKTSKYDVRELTPAFYIGEEEKILKSLSATLNSL